MIVQKTLSLFHQAQWDITTWAHNKGYLFSLGTLDTASACVLEDRQVTDWLCTCQLYWFGDLFKWNTHIICSIFILIICNWMNSSHTSDGWHDGTLLLQDENLWVQLSSTHVLNWSRVSFLGIFFIIYNKCIHTADIKKIKFTLILYI